MLNESRVRQMTKMAMFEEKQGRRYQPILHYSKRDFLTLNQIIGIVVGTLFYVFVYGIILAALLATVVGNLHYLTVIVIILAGVLLYVGYMYFYLHRVKKYALQRYEEGQQLIKQLQDDYDILEEMYEEEEQMKAPEGWE